MIERVIEIELLTYWRSGTGRPGGPTVAEGTIAQRHGGLPYLPGRKLKGRLKQALLDAEHHGGLDPGTTGWLCGAEPWTENRYATDAGRLRVGSARLPEAWQRWAGTGRPEVRQLFRELPSTALDDDRQVAAGTLRRLLVAVPMTLEACLQVQDADAWPFRTSLPDALRLGLRWLREISGDEHNLGRCIATLRP